MFSIKNKSSGFTLIELLIVIAIIGVLATIFMSNFIGVRQRARDSQRKSNLRQIQAALELIRSNTDSYPTSLYPADRSGDCPTSSPLQVGTPAVIYMNKIPCDPSSISIFSGPPGNYGYSLSGSTYSLFACIENTNDAGQNIFPIGAAVCTTQKVYQLTNP